MTEISCEMCMDLIPLVRDGAASQDSQTAVLRHLKTCPSCSALYSGETVPPSDPSAAFQKLHRRLRFLFALLMMFGIFLGLGLTASDGMFYNTLIMPIIGALGYGIFRTKAFYQVPGLLFIAHGLIHLCNLLRGADALDLVSLLTWTLIYILFALAGTLAAWLLHFAFRKET